ncbi:hypothetical protein A2U01_0053942, partial [Trifolium medium]|nr:hypothetical protein [Trifolium medium]
MVATNILSLTLSTTLQSPKSPKPLPPIPDELLRQLHTSHASKTPIQTQTPNPQSLQIYYNTHNSHQLLHLGMFVSVHKM